MNKISILLLIASLNLFGQSSILQLKNDLKEISFENPAAEPAAVQFKKKSPMLAILYSLVLPGMGELYADNFSGGKYFTIAEGSLWGMFAGINFYANSQKENYKSFAASSGGVNTGGKDEEYFGNISSYRDIDEYNNAMALKREFDKMYNDPSYKWNWGSEQNRKKYREMWVTSEQAYNSIRFIVGGLILNRVASAVMAVRAVARYNRRTSEDLGWNVSFGVENHPALPSTLTLNFQTSF